VLFSTVVLRIIFLISASTFETTSDGRNRNRGSAFIYASVAHGPCNFATHETREAIRDSARDTRRLGSSRKKDSLQEKRQLSAGQARLLPQIESLGNSGTRLLLAFASRL
jgi:hypothetical protein